MVKYVFISAFYGRPCDLGRNGRKCTCCGKDSLTVFVGSQNSQKNSDLHDLFWHENIKVTHKDQYSSLYLVTILAFPNNIIIIYLLESFEANMRKPNLMTLTPFFIRLILNRYTNIMCIQVQCRKFKTVWTMPLARFPDNEGFEGQTTYAFCLPQNHIFVVLFALSNYLGKLPEGSSKINRLSLNRCPPYTEIFSKRRKIYAVCVESLSMP